MLQGKSSMARDNSNPLEGKQLHNSASFEGSQLLDGSVRSFVVRSGRLTEAQRRAIEVWGPTYIIPYTPLPLDFAKLFDEQRPVILEIGFGMGQATWQIARDRPNYNYLGIEIHAPGVGRLIMDLREHNISNVRIIQHDALEVLRTAIPPESLAGLHIFFPDPWPKKRHHKRRLMQKAVICLMAEKLASGGYLYFVTDIEEYGEFAKNALESCNMLANRYEGFAPHQDWRPVTKFEGHAFESGRGTFELVFIKR